MSVFQFLTKSFKIWKMSLLFIVISSITITYSIGMDIFRAENTILHPSGFRTKCSMSTSLFGNLSNSSTVIDNDDIIINTRVILKTLLITLGLSLLLSMFSYILLHHTRMAKFVNKFPGPSHFPFIGNINILMVRPEGLIPQIANLTTKFGRCFRFWLFHTPYVAIVEAGAAEKLLSSPMHIDKGRDYETLTWILGNGLITSNGDTWRMDRKLLNPSFKYQRFDGFLATFNKHGKILKEILDNVFPKGDLGERNLHPTFCMCTMDSISEASLGKPTSFQRDPDQNFIEAVYTSFESCRLRGLKPWLVLPIIWDIFGMGREERRCLKYFKNALGQTIEARRTARLINDGEVTKPFIDTMLDCRSEDEIISHVITTFLAGLETTASGINYSLYLLAVNPEIQAKVHQELDEVFGDDMDRDVTFDDLTKIKYLEMCIKEVMRLYPPVPQVIRSPKSDIELDNGLIIPRGTQVVLFIHELHRDPSVFPDPERFDPERFLPDVSASRSHYAYQPFSIGPRSCIGRNYAIMQIKVILCHILRYFRVSSSKRREDLEVMMGMVLEPKGGIPLRLTKRV